MAKTLQHRRDTTANLASVTGSVGEIFIDTTLNQVVVMDGSTAGGHPLGAAGATGVGINGATGVHGASGVGINGATGIQGASGSTGLQGASGSTGLTGSTGVQGAQGTFGGEAVDILFSNDVNVTDPTSGKFKFNNATFSSVTKMSISHTDHLSTNIATIIHSIDDSTSTVKGYFSVSLESDPDVYVVFSITGLLTDHTTWDEVPVQWMSGATTLTNGGDYIVTFQRSGDKGDTGLTGATGANGQTGATGSNGAAGSNGATGVGVNGATGVHGASGAAGASGAGASYNQSLNTTDNVVFASGLIGEVSIVGDTVSALDTYGMPGGTLVIDGNISIPTISPLAIGSYAFLRLNSSYGLDVLPGQDVISTAASGPLSTAGVKTTGAVVNWTTVDGTWRCMGYAGVVTNSSNISTLWYRVS